MCYTISLACMNSSTTIVSRRRILIVYLCMSHYHIPKCCMFSFNILVIGVIPPISYWTSPRETRGREIVPRDICLLIGRNHIGNAHLGWDLWSMPCSLHVKKNLPQLHINILIRNGRRQPVARRISRLHLLYRLSFHCSHYVKPVLVAPIQLHALLFIRLIFSRM